MPSLLYVSEGSLPNVPSTQLDSSSIICSPSELLQDTHKGPFDEIYLLSPFQDEKMLLQLAQRLRPSAKLFIQTNKIQNGSQMEKQLIVALTKAGYVDIKTTTEDQISATKPDWELGASQALRLPAKNKVQTPSSSTVWTLDDDDDTQLDDEDALLQEEDLKLPAKKQKDDCEVGKGGTRKACKNCSCGRKEGTSSTPTPQLKSSCGNCYLGDAFRCGGCPFLGKPAFKPGEEKLVLNLDSADL